MISTLMRRNPRARGLILPFFVCLTLSFGLGSAIASGKGASSIVVMVPPEGFRFNSETAKSNSYQHSIKDPHYRTRAMAEFNAMVSRLRKNGIQVILLHQSKQYPDAVFPNNWFSTHINSTDKTTLILYPMYTANRQAEVNRDGLIKVLKQHGISIDNIVDLRNKTDDVLEGTGSMVLDREHHIIYASLSPRTRQSMVYKVAKLLHYTPVVFHATDDKNTAIYHTNVMMGIASQYAVVCLECIQNKKERTAVMNSLTTSKHEIIAINHGQVTHLCGNVLELISKSHGSLLVMSQQAYEHFSPTQRRQISAYSKPLPMDLTTIEIVGGGSARCMLAEVFSKK